MEGLIRCCLHYWFHNKTTRKRRKPVKQKIEEVKTKEQIKFKKKSHVEILIYLHKPIDKDTYIMFVLVRKRCLKIIAYGTCIIVDVFSIIHIKQMIYIIKQLMMSRI